MEGIYPGFSFLVVLLMWLMVMIYLAWFSEEVDAGETAKCAYHAVEAKAAAHEKHEEELLRA
jgi:uncharacterized protein (UPF0333 family)